ncbi:MAG TPA: glycosyltransferase family 2 protein [Firmicutes bacterium]|nr:glycosyltransferase family 2 protein [Bacillota bacterium]
MIDVSVVTPSYNRGHLLPRVWASLANQQVGFEWIVVDDGSTDDTNRVIADLNDPRIVYIALPKNSGVNAARNAGVSAARGRYVVFLDSDDELYEGSLGRMVEVMDGADPGVGVAAFACTVADTGRQICQLPDGHVLNEYDLVCGGALYGGDKIFMYRREVFDQFRLPADLKGCEHVFLNEVSKAWKYLMVNQPLSIVHRQSDNLSNADSLIARSLDIARSYERVLQNHADILEHEPSVVTRYLKKALFRYGVAGSRRDVWRIYLRLMHQSISLQDRIEGTVLLALSMLGLASFERWRINCINRRLIGRDSK